MNLPDNLLGEAWYWAAWAVWLPLFALCVWRAPWRRLADTELLNVWLGMVVLLTVVWSLKAGVRPGLSLHLLGAMLFTLSFGPYLAFVGLVAVLLGVTLNGGAGPFAFAANSLLLGGVGVGVAHAFFSVVSRCLPAHFFVYVFMNGFVGAALSTLSVGLAASVFLSVSDAYDWDYLFGEFFPYFMLLGFSEAWLSGAILTVFVVYRPAWVATFDDARYLSNK